MRISILNSNFNHLMYKIIYKLTDDIILQNKLILFFEFLKILIHYFKYINIALINVEFIFKKDTMQANNIYKTKIDFIFQD